MAKTRPDGSPLTPDDREYWERPYTFQEFPKAMYRFATTTDGRVKLQDGGVELETRPVATSGEEAQATADGWLNNQPDAIVAGKRVLQEQEERDRKAADRRYIDGRKRLIELDRQARLELSGGRDQVLAAGDESKQAASPPLSSAPTIKAAADARSLESAVTLGEQLTALREEAKWTVDELAERLKVDRTNVLDHLAGKSMPRRRNREQYEAIFSAQLRRPVKLNT